MKPLFQVPPNSDPGTTQKTYQLPVVDGYDHVVVAGYNLFTDSQRFQRESQSPRSLLAALGLETPTLPSTQAYLGF